MLCKAATHVTLATLRSSKRAARTPGTVPHYSQLQVPKGVSKCTQIRIQNNHSDTLHTMNLVSAVLSFVFEDDLRLATYKDKLNEYSNRPY